MNVLRGHLGDSWVHCLALLIVRIIVRTDVLDLSYVDPLAICGDPPYVVQEVLRP